VFGSIVDAIVHDDSSVALLDAQAGVVRLISPNGSVVHVVGGFGKGPGELAEPVALFEAPSGSPSVVDAEGRRIQEFDIHGSNQSPSLRLSMLPQDACVIGGRHFVLGPLLTNDSTGALAMKTVALIHEVDGSGSVRRSFSTPYRYSNLVLSYTYGVGRLTCHGDWMWAAYSVLGEIHALRPSGELYWIAKLTDLRFPKQIEAGNRIGSDPAGTLTRELITNISLISSDVLAVQVQSRQRPDISTRTWTTSYRTYLLQARTGLPIAAFSADHEVIGGGHGKAVLYRADPHPQVQVVDIGGLQ
jgi:hypothetical protein